MVRDNFSMLPIVAFLLVLLALLMLWPPGVDPLNDPELKQSGLLNPIMADYRFLEYMAQDSYFPSYLVRKGQNILVTLCYEIESQSPKSPRQVYKLTHAATRKFNALQAAFFREDSEIETAAAENIARDIAFIGKSYGFDLKIEKAISPRYW